MISTDAQRAVTHDVTACDNTSCVVCIGAVRGQETERWHVVEWLRERAAFIASKSDDFRLDGDEVGAIRTDQRAEVLQWAATCIERFDHYEQRP